MVSFLVALNEGEKCQKVVIESERAGFNSSDCHWISAEKGKWKDISFLCIYFFDRDFASVCLCAFLSSPLDQDEP